MLTACFYLTVVFGLSFYLEKAHIPVKISILLAGLFFGSAVGLVNALIWPSELNFLFNFPAALFGDWIYQAAIQYIGDPHSAQTHFTIPWLLRLPQVYVLASVLCWGTAGAIAQLIYNVATRRKPALMRKTVD